MRVQCVYYECVFVARAMCVLWIHNPGAGPYNQWEEKDIQQGLPHKGGWAQGCWTGRSGSQGLRLQIVNAFTIWFTLVFTIQCLQTHSQSSSYLLWFCAIVRVVCNRRERDWQASMQSCQLAPKRWTELRSIVVRWGHQFNMNL